MKVQTNIILYIDDEQANLNAFQLLFGEKYNVLTTVSCMEGLKLLETYNISLIISDQKMPEMNGVDFLQIVKARWPEVMSILLTGYVERQTLEIAINQIGIYQFISKPFDPIQMELIINQALDSLQMKRSLTLKTIELEISEEKLSKIIESAADAILTLDGKQNIVMANKASVRIFGYSSDELLKLSINKIIPEGISQIQGGQFNYFVRSDLSTMYLGRDYTVLAVDARGKLFPVEGTLSKMDIDGETYVNAIIRNVNDNVNVENELRESESQLRVLAESAPIIIFKIDRSYSINFINKSNFNGLDFTNILGRNLFDLISGDKVHMKECIDNVFRNASSDQFDMMYTDSENNDFYYSTTIGPMVKNGAVENVMLLSSDITEQFRAQRVLRALTDLQNTFIGDNPVSESFNEMLKILLKITNSNYGFICEVNFKNNETNLKPLAIKDKEIGVEKSGFEDEFGSKHEEFSFMKTLFEKVSLTKEPHIRNINYKNSKSISSDTDSKISSYLGLPFFRKNKLIGMVGIAKMNSVYDENDIKILEPFLLTCSTLIEANISHEKKMFAKKEAANIKEEFTKNLELKVMERTKELEEARGNIALSLEKEKELGDLKSLFVATASHQFRTPLSVIQSSMGVLAMQKDKMSDEFRLKFESSFDRIKEHITRMTVLMDDVLILGKINAGSVILDKEPIDLISLCNEIIINYDAIQLDGRKVVFEQEGISYMVDLDLKLMEHAISNLVSNAFKYSISSEKDPILRLCFEEQQVRICVKDFGIGIPLNDIDQLFEPFYRASNANNFSGSGLGSSIAKEYIELNGGVLSLKSEVGNGSEFTILFNKL